jgi:methylphosphotriester-DNA--protein-cysteine methyltransferase
MLTTTKKTYGTRICKWCSNTFIAARSNQIYCDKECCKKATNQNSINRYHAKKALAEQKARVCRNCPTILSKYNDDELCNACQRIKDDDQRIAILKRLGFGYESD